MPDESEEGRRFAEKLNRGILVLIAAPFLVVAGVALAGPTAPARRERVRNRHTTANTARSE